MSTEDAVQEKTAASAAIDRAERQAARIAARQALAEQDETTRSATVTDSSKLIVRDSNGVVEKIVEIKYFGPTVKTAENGYERATSSLGRVRRVLQEQFGAPCHALSKYYNQKMPMERREADRASCEEVMITGEELYYCKEGCPFYRYLDCNRFGKPVGATTATDSREQNENSNSSISPVKDGKERFPTWLSKYSDWSPIENMPTPAYEEDRPTLPGLELNSSYSLWEIADPSPSK